MDPDYRSDELHRTHPAIPRIRPSISGIRPNRRHRAEQRELIRIKNTCLSLIVPLSECIFDCSLIQGLDGDVMDGFYRQ